MSSTIANVHATSLFAYSVVSYEDSTEIFLNSFSELSHKPLFLYFFKVLLRKVFLHDPYNRLSEAKVVYYGLVCKLPTISKTKLLTTCFILPSPIIFAHCECSGIQTLSMFGQWSLRVLNKRSSKIYLHQSYLYICLYCQFFPFCVQPDKINTEQGICNF